MKMAWRLFQCFQESVESRSGKHVHLVDDIYFVFADLGWDAYLFHQLADVVDGVIGSGIQFMDVVGTLLIEGCARLALIACLSVRGGTHAVDGFGKDAGTSGFSHATRTAKEVSMRQLSGGDGILQGGGQCVLPYHRIKGRGTVFPGRYDIVFHIRDILCFLCKCTQKKEIFRLFLLSLCREVALQATCVRELLIAK